MNFGKARFWCVVVSRKSCSSILKTDYKVLAFLFSYKIYSNGIRCVYNCFCFYSVVFLAHYAKWFLISVWKKKSRISGIPVRTKTLLCQNSWNFQRARFIFDRTNFPRFPLNVLWIPSASIAGSCPIFQRSTTRKIRWPHPAPQNQTIFRAEISGTSRYQK